MNSNLPKQFMLLKGKPVIYYTIKVFLEAYDDLELIVVLPAEFISVGKEMLSGYFSNRRIQITAGGDTRFQSVKNGLALAEGESIIFVHDGVRCLVSNELIRRCYVKAVEDGSAVPVIPSMDSVRLLTDCGNEVADRNKVMLVQTPQTFQSNILLQAFSVAYKEGFTDEATVVEAAGYKVSLVEGEETNIKITRPVDLIIAEQLLNNNY
jgi:2-C-methyl-D-erythritol 4-phosphate cytidylyltransferase